MALVAVPISKMSDRAISTCQAGHQLEAVFTQHDRCYCDLCRVRVPPQTKMHSCLPCDFALCGHCLTRRSELDRELHELVQTNAVLLFMKGTPQQPRCGFSRQVVALLRTYVDDAFVHIDVLEEPEIRDGVKVFSEWPTFPQLYVNGQFIGGCDIVVQMHSDGELKPFFEKHQAKIRMSSHVDKSKC